MNAIVKESFLFYLAHPYTIMLPVSKTSQNSSNDLSDQTDKPPPYEEPYEDYNTRYQNNQAPGLQQLSITTGNKIDSVWRMLPFTILSAYDQLKPAEINYPGFVLCSDCVTFHGRSRNPGALIDVDCAAGKQRIAIGGGQSLDWWSVHLVMRSHRLSPEHGVTWKEIYGSRSWDTQDWELSLVSMTKSNRLLLRVTGQTWVELDKVVKIPPGAPCCKHGYYGAPLSHKMLKTILGFTAGGGKAHFRSPLYRCAWCPTEIRISVESVSGNLLPRCTVTTYTDLGSAEKTSSREWYVMIHECLVFYSLLFTKHIAQRQSCMIFW